MISTADGKIVSAIWENGWGNIVRIQHANGYSTHYAHLSAFADGIGVGDTVTQGQVIGFVGSTGWSTGPHLDYGMRLSGAPVNPLTLRQPKGERLPESELESFLVKVRDYESLLEA